MTPENWQKVMQLFTDVRQMDSLPEREDFLQTECKDKPDLLIEVKKLLAGESKNKPAYFDKPLFGTSFNLDEIAEVIEDNHENDYDVDDDMEHLENWITTDTVVGKFKIINKIGAGGMGIVYRAIQEYPQRVVALKMMKHSVATRKTARRFRYEVDILGKLQHKNIAQIYEAGVYHRDSSYDGESEGLPYFVMELIVDAQNLIDYTQANNLNTKQRLELYCAVCDGVQHGHQNGIIHRDLKPSNILIGADGHPKIIDFGVAKAIGGKLDITTMQTDSGKLIGTVQYMSPEQCDVGQSNVTVDTRSDVYTLGILLYQLLCDKLPYNVSDSSLVAAARSVCDAVIVHPATIKRNLKGDLAAIILKALSRNPAARYQSAGELGKDISNYLRGDIIIARPPTSLDKMLGYIKTHPILVTTFICVCISLFIVGGSYFTYINLKSKPSQIIYNERTQSAQLISYSGKFLKEWKNVWNAQLIDLPPESGGGKIAAICYSMDGNSITSGRLCLYNAYKTAEPITILPLPVRPDNMPWDWIDQLDTAPENDLFFTSNFITADIYKDIPGLELVVITSHLPEFPNNISIYDTTGKLLGSQWHKGFISAVTWDEDNEQLIVSGRRNDWYNEIAGFEDLNLSASANIQIIYAIKPPQIDSDIYTIRDGVLARNVNWYKYIVPHTAWELMIISRDCIIVLKDINNTSNWRITMFGSEQSNGMYASVNIIFDPITGDNISIFHSNGYETNQPALPSPESIKFCDYPPTREELLDAMRINSLNTDNN